MSDHWVHDIDPVLVRFSSDPDIAIRWYGVSYLLGLLWGLWMVMRWAKLGRVPMARHEVQDFVITCGLGMIIGGRLGYVLFYDPALLTTFTASAPWWGLLAVNQGGMASHGGIIGLATGCWWFAHRRRRSFAVLADTIAATGPLGVALGRIANFINAELPGRPSDAPWAVIFPGAPLVDGVNVARHPSQLYAACLEGLLVLAVVLIVHARHRRPGLSSGAFLVAYGIGRFVGEFFRLPDAGQPGFDAAHPAILGFMSKGQAFTVPMIIIGVIVIWWTLRHPPRPELYLPPPAPT